MEINLSDYVNSKVFVQLEDDRFQHHVVSFFINLNPAKCNYKIYIKELVAIIRYFKL